MYLRGGAENIKITVQFSSSDKGYSEQMLNGLADSIAGCNTAHCIIGGGHMQEAYKEGWEVMAKYRDFAFYTHAVPEFSFVQIRGKVKSISPDLEGNSWAEIAQSYDARVPSRDTKAVWKERIARVKLDVPWSADVVNQKMVVDGTIKGKLNGEDLVYIEAYNSNVMQ